MVKTLPQGLVAQRIYTVDRQKSIPFRRTICNCSQIRPEPPQNNLRTASKPIPSQSYLDTDARIDRPTVQLPDRLWQNEKRYKPFLKNFLWQTLLRVALFFRLRLSSAKMK
jgi:hypothetical protein